MSDFSVDGMAIAPSVVKTIVSIAAAEVDGVAAVGAPAQSGLRQVFSGKTANDGVEVTAEDDGRFHIAVRLKVKFGCVLPDVAEQVRQAVSDAVASQVGARVSGIDVYIDDIAFES